MSFNPAKWATIRVHFKLVYETFESYGQLMRWPKCHKMKMIDIGGGPGEMLRNIEKLLPKDYAEIFCVDKQVAMVEYFESVPKDSRIKTGVFDIEVMDVPDEMRGRFDLIFSSFCFSYTNNFSQIFKNCNRFLRPDGEIFAIWSKTPHVYVIYHHLSTTNKWREYTKDYENWKKMFEDKNSSQQLAPFMENYGFEILKCEDLNDNKFCYRDKQHLFEALASMDTVSHRIPKYDLQKYREDFNKIALTQMETNEDDPNGIVKHIIPSIAVAAKKIKSI